MRYVSTKSILILIQYAVIGNRFHVHLNFEMLNRKHLKKKTLFRRIFIKMILAWGNAFPLTTELAGVLE